MSNSVASSYSAKVGRSHQRKYNIAPELLASPYLSRPIGLVNSSDRKKKRNSNNGGELQKSKSDEINKDGDKKYSSDMESIASKASFASCRARQSSYRQSTQISAQRWITMKYLLLPRETEKVIRGFRQRHSSHPFFNTPSATPNGNCPDNDDDSTIVSESAQSLDDEAVYLECIKNEKICSAVFSGPLFAEIVLRDSAKNVLCEEDLPNSLPPLVAPVKDKEDVSDLESLHS
mmetsp:Transcript_21403/g.44915  ORF Transcript_21403/g.44915 Transcript_21403/m.44915 type:complete len:233 (-) Transcript_21403:1818-2516(-)